MPGQYSYSFNGDDFTGRYETREEAQGAAFDAARRANLPPTTVYVGRVVEADPGAQGHALQILSQMALRLRRECCEGSERNLAQLTAAQVDDLDHELAGVIESWLKKNELTPTTCRVVAISEHPVPAEPENHLFSADEVHDLGVEQLAGAGAENL
ncbi:MAG: hypothetical protein ABSH22_15385 [Tepidisphaeraceae bacterium]|jgi:hypothetical protein